MARIKVLTCYLSVSQHAGCTPASATCVHSVNRLEGLSKVRILMWPERGEKQWLSMVLRKSTEGISMLK